MSIHHSFTGFKSSLKTLLLTGAIALAAISPAQAAAEGFSEAQKTEAQAIIKDYLLNNPEVVVQALEAYRTQQEKAQEEKAAQKIKEYESYFKSADLPFAGNAEAGVQVVEFFDYNCGYCKHALPDIQSILKEDKDVKVIFMEMPILGPASLDAAKWAEAAKNQGKYFEFHQAVMESTAPKDEENLGKIATDLGLDVAKLKTDAASDEIQQRINKSMQISQEIGIHGTPAFIINGKFYPGYLGADGLKNAIAEARKGDQAGQSDSQGEAVAP